MADAIDVEPVRAALRGSASTAAGQLPPAQRGRLVALLGKAEASHDGRLRGHRHTMLDDSDISSTRHARAFVCGALAGLVGHAEIYVSGGAEHQGPDGGGPVALIVDRSRDVDGSKRNIDPLEVHLGPTMRLCAWSSQGCRRLTRSEIAAKSRRKPGITASTAS